MKELLVVNVKGVKRYRAQYNYKSSPRGDAHNSDQWIGLLAQIRCELSGAVGIIGP